ncbi:hemicentin-1 isoform X1 [Rana temporaria]|uniref:hemicentin-1 isoform X1 n=1 Tax=Rana temporaria TaxID=8407 RepID=UPI001AADE118|nr:hemicentin-1 isoform X1 [Rana temporaria]
MSISQESEIRRNVRMLFFRNFSIQLPIVLLLLQLLQLNSCAESEPDIGKTPDGASTLAFVFDVTGSMYDDLVQVIDGASKILETSLNRQKKPLYNFALVPFHDPEIGPVTITTDPETFQNELKELYVQGGGDCPEMSVGAIKIALEISLPGSFIYVFTDARSKDYQLASDVLQLIQQKQSQVVFVLTGDCDDRGHVGYKVYEEIASTSSGQVFHLDKKQVKEVLKWVEETVQASKVHLMSTDHSSEASFTWEIPFDPSLKEVTVSLSGPAPDIELYNPLGRQMKPETGLNELLNIYNSAKVLNIKEPIPGMWKIKTSSSARHSVRITGVSTVDFQAGFSNKPTLDFSKTSSRPIEGILTYVLLNTTGLQHPARIDRLDLLTISGKLLESIPVKYYPDKIPYEIWNVTEFIPPNEAFILRITGYDKDDYLFQRASSVSFSNIIPGVPKVSMPEVTPGYYLQLGHIPCSVESLIPITLHFSKNGVRLGPEQKFRESVNTSWVIANVSSLDEGYYDCFVTSSAGSGRARTFLDVNEPPPVIKASNNITINIGKQAILSCNVLSTVSYNLTWLRNKLDLRQASVSGIQVLSNNSLKIISVDITDAGEYICFASNEGGTAAASVILTVQDPPKVLVEPKNETFTKGLRIKLKCSATGFPVPQIVWTHNDMFLTYSSRYVITEDGSFIIKNAVEKDSGIYTCLAANNAGTDRQTSKLTYIEAPVVTVFRKEMLIAVDTEANIECKATGIPEPQFDWYKGDVKLSTSSHISIDHIHGTLAIKSTQYINAGEYTCEARNEAGKSSGKVTITVGAAPVFTQSPSDIAIDIGSNVILPCSVQGFPEPKIKWSKLTGTTASSKPLVPQQKTGALKITNLWVGDEGTYICEAENQFGKIQAQATVTLTGLVIPVIGESPPVVNVIEGNQVTLPCILLAGNPLPVRQWLRNNEVLISSPYVSIRSDGTLHLESVHLKDSGEYICVATNVAGTSRRVTAVNVHVIPVIKHGPQIFSTVEGNAISLPCKASGVPTPSIIWKKKGENVVPNNGTILIDSDGSLFLSTPHGEDSGEYSCSAINAAGYATRKVQLTVYVKPRILNTGSSSLQDGFKGQIEISAKVSDDVVLPCEVKSVPPPFITWAKETQLISPFSQRHTILPPGSMRILDVRVTDAGTYTCVATNIAGNVTQIVTLNVYAPPKIQRGPQMIRIQVKQSFEIACISQGIPPPRTAWFKDGRMLTLDEKLQHFTIRVASAELSDAGVYTCIASNMVGQDSANVTIEVQAPPTLSDLEPPYDKTHQERLSSQQVAFPCPAKGNPKPVIKWLRNNKELSGTEPGIKIAEDGTLLIISSLTSYDNGEYKCVASNQAGLTERKYNLKVHDPPAIKDKEKLTNVSVLLSHDTNLFCDATGSPPPFITWYNGSTQVIESDNIKILEKGRILKIMKTTLSHSGSFSCTASNIAGSDEKHFFVDVLEPPEIAGRGTVDDISVIIGRAAKLKCEVKGKPYPAIQWFKDNRLVGGGDTNVNILENGQTLYIKNSRLTDSGQYKCVATNSAGLQTKESKLVVNVPPSIKNENTTTELSFNVDSRVSLECDVWGIPHPAITWYTDGKRIQASTHISFIENGKYLHISEVKVTHSGKYKCYATNSAGHAEREYLLDVYAPASIHKDLSKPQTTKVIVGKTLVLECEATGHPLPLITWLKEGVPIQISDNIRLLYNGKKLEIKSTVESDQGQYICVATNLAGKSEMIYNVHILVPPTIEDIDDPGEYTVIASNPVELECYIKGIPLPAVMWLKNGIPLEPSNDLHIQDKGQKLIISSSGSSDSGVYECVVKNEAGTSRKIFNVNVHVLPSIKPEPSPLSVVMRKPIILQCIATGIPSPQITWLKDGLPFNIIKENISVESFGRILHFKSTMTDDAGKYSCVASNAAGEAEQSIWLNVYEPPKIENSDEVHHETILGNQSVRLECKASGNPDPVVTWLKDNHPLTIVDNILLSNQGQVLQITNAKIHNAGVYKCVASSLVGTAEMTYVLQVHVLPSIFGNNDPVSVIVNKPVRLECEATGFPAPSLTWLKDGIPVSSISGGIQILSGGRVLMLANTRIGDAGKYTCVAVNAAGEHQKDFDLSVYVPPNIMGEQQNITILMGQKLSLKCESNAIPPPVLMWFKDWRPLVNRPGLGISESGQFLEIENAQVKDTGRYSCEAVNIAGRTQRNFNVNILVPPTIKDSEEESDVTVIEGTLISLVCDSSGIPPPALTWKKNDTPVTPDSKGRIRFLSGGRHLHIAVAMESDASSYTCTASNTAGNAAKKYNVKVYVHPSISGGGPAPLDVVVIEENNVTMECDPSGSPQPMLTWLREGIPLNNGDGLKILRNGRQLHLEKAQASDSGLYLCVAVNVAGQADKKYDLKVFVPPRILGSFEEHENVSVVERNPVTLTCEVSGIPPPKITWFKDGQPIHPNNTPQVMSGGMTLRFVHTALSDAGRYKCVVSNAAGVKNKEFHLNVLVPPRLTGNVLEDIKVKEKSDVVLSCEATGNPVPQITWLKDGQPLQEDTHHRIKDGGQHFQIISAMETDTGRYTCIVSNLAGDKSRRFSLAVMVSPIISGAKPKESPEDISVIQDSSVLLACEVHSIPTSTIVWYKDGQQIHSKDNIRILPGGHTLQILKAHEDNFGKYSCIAANEAGVAEHHYNLKVYTPPRITKDNLAGTGYLSKQIKAKVGTNISLECNVQAFPVATVRWYKDGQPLDPRSLIVNGNKLNIDKADLSDTGRYTCVASNVAGEDELDFDVNIQVPPNFPKLSSLLLNTDSSIVERIGERKDVIVNNPFTLYCETNAIPPPTITWYKDGKVLTSSDKTFLSPGGHSLQIARARMEDAGTYSCVAVNEAGEDSLQYNVRILLPPTFEGGSENLSEDVSFLANQTVLLDCVGESIPAPTVSWQKDGQAIKDGKHYQILSDGRYLQISNAELSDTGRYICIVENVAGSAQKLFKLNIYVPPKVTGDAFENVTAIENDFISLSCDVTGFPPPAINWIKDGNVLSSSKHLLIVPGGRVLQIPQMKLTDAGDYVCVAINQAGESKKTFYLSIFVPPTIIGSGRDSSTEVNINIATSASLECFTNAVPPAVINWYKNGQMLLESTNYIILDEGQIMKIKNAQVSDTGEYECVATNVAGQDKKTFLVNVYVPPSIQGPQVEYNNGIIENSVTLHCNAYGIPPPTITWLKDGNPINYSDSLEILFLSGGSIMKITRAQLTNSGNYTCLASNIEGSTHKTFILAVQVPPSITGSGTSNEVNALPDDDVQLMCKTRGVPTPVVHWSKDGQPINTDDRLNIRKIDNGEILSIPKVQRADMGKYTCVAINLAGEDDRIFHLNVYVPPKIADNEETVSIAAALETSVNIECFVTGDPTPQINWLKNGLPLPVSSQIRPLSSGKILRISRLQKSDEGFYTCVASNRAGVDKKKYNLKVYIAPTMDGSDITEELTTIKGNPTTMRCIADGYPEPHISWLRNGKYIDLVPNKGTTFHILNTEITDIGRYTCTATNEAGSISKHFILNVLEPPHINGSRYIDELSVTINNQVELVCYTTGFPSPLINWLKDGQLLSQTENVHFIKGGQILQITSAQEENVGLYTCLASNNAGNTKKEFSVKVHMPPNIAGINGIHNITSLKDKQVTLECKSDAVPPPEITWLKDNKPLLPSVRIHIESDGRFVHINSAEVEDAGHYICIARNIAGKTTREFILNIYVPPTIKDGPNLVTSFVNNPANLECKAAGVPLPRISWRKNGAILHENNERYTVMESGTLYFPSANVTDSGLYTCLAANAAGSNQKQTKLLVYDPPLINSGSTNITTIVNNEITLNCEVTGTPKPTVEWKKNGLLINTNMNYNIYRFLSSGSLIIISTAVEDTGMYVCFASNDAGHDEIAIYLSVLVPPSIADEVTNIFINKLSSSIIPCTTYGVPQPVVHWLKDGIRLPAVGESYKILSSGSIEIPRTDLTHTGRYSCKAINEVGSAEIHINLYVQEVPVIYSQGDYFEATVNNSITLSCEALGTPSPTITWQKEGVGIKTGGHFTMFINGNLNIAYVTQEDGGTYTCIAQNPAGTALGKIKLKVLEPPLIKPHKKEYTVVVDEPVTMICEAFGNPMPEIAWHKNGAPLSKSAVQRIIGTGALQIGYAQPDDAGLYTCTAENAVGSMSSSMNLSVLVPPQIQKKINELFVIQSFPVTIPCNTYGIPTPSIAWTKNNVSIADNSEKYAVTKSGDLILRQTEHHDMGNYTCTASNIVGKDSHTISITIQYGPSFTELPSDVSLNKEEKLRLTCKATGNPRPQITWTFKHKSTPVQIGQSKYLNDFVIERVSKEDSGTYTCIAENIVASINTTVKVFVKEPPVLVGFHHTNLTAALGGSIILNCIVQGNPIPKIQWNKKENDIPFNRRFKQFNNGSLAIYNTTNEDIGDFICIATNDAGTMGHTVTLSLQKPPIIKSPPVDMTVNAGTSVVLNCQAEGEPVPDIFWSRLTRPISGDSRFSILSNKSLHIVAVRKEDTSVYECRATNVMGSAVAKSSFIVQVHGGFSEWLPWQSCSVTCGQGIQKRMRLCDNPAPANGGLYCQGEESETRLCQNKPCPADASWLDWSPWEECSKTCGSGKQTRTRICNIPPAQEGGKTCDGKAIDTKVCNIKSCPVDGEWSSWQVWGPCSKTCGKGTQIRARLCNNPPPSFGGTFCEGQDTQSQICNIRHCPVDGKWSPWGSWTPCSVSCNGGLRQRTRECSSPQPQYGGHKCKGKAFENEFCNGDSCPIHGNWGPWSAWETCSRTCNGGQRRRHRTCDSPTPSHNGRGCAGKDTEIHKCNTEICPADSNWGPWEAWSKCSVSCGGGQQIRTRICKHPVRSNNGRTCPGDSTQLLRCNVQGCQGGVQSVRGTLSGTINDVDLHIAQLNGSVSNNSESHASTIKATFTNIPKSLGSSMRNLASLLDPIYWTVAKERGEAVNGFTLTGGEFIRETQVEFATGEIMRITHNSRGLDADGFLLVDTVVKGYIPQLPISTNIKLKGYTEDYVQTGLGQLYAYSTRMFYLDEVSVPYTWNHTVSYDPSHGKMPVMLETLHVSSIGADYNPLEETLSFQMHAFISKGDIDDQCPPGFSYDISGLYCADDDECAINSPCTQSCHNIMGSYYCSCPKGFMTSPDGRTCLDIDECTLEESVCRKNQECKNSIGSYICVLKCGTGFTAAPNGLECQDINECKESNPCHQRCFNTIGSYRCGCDPGYHLKGRSCFDLNECHQNVCRPDQLCRNTRGSYKCIDICPIGFTKAENGSCVDIDECRDSSHRCKSNQICENTQGRYLCVCPRGFKSEGPGKPCKDVNECEKQDVCQHECRNVLGSYQCLCPTGYQLMANEKTCQDIDECLVHNIHCGVNQMCFNMRGSHQCIDTPCPPNYVRDSSGYCLKNCAPNDLECALSPYALQYKLVSLPFGIAANQDLIRLVAYTQDGILHPRTTFLITDEDSTVPFSIREENMKGVVFTNRPLKEPETYRMKVRALSYSTDRTIEYQTTFIVYISVSPYPY